MLFDVRNTSVKVPDLNSQKRLVALVLASAWFCPLIDLPSLPAFKCCRRSGRCRAGQSEASPGSLSAGLQWEASDGKPGRGRSVRELPDSILASGWSPSCMDARLGSTRSASELRQVRDLPGCEQMQWMQILLAAAHRRFPGPHEQSECERLSSGSLATGAGAHGPSPAPPAATSPSSGRSLAASLPLRGGALRACYCLRVRGC